MANDETSADDVVEYSLPSDTMAILREFLEEQKSRVVDGRVEEDWQVEATDASPLPSIVIFISAEPVLVHGGHLHTAGRRGGLGAREGGRRRSGVHIVPLPSGVLLPQGGMSQGPPG